MSHLGIGAEEYDNLLNTCAAQLGRVMSITVLEQVESEEAISENLHRLLKELAESADILGADRFVRSYARLKEGKSLTRSHYVAVFKALQELDSALTANSSPAPQADAPH